MWCFLFKKKKTLKKREGAGAETNEQNIKETFYKQKTSINHKAWHAFGNKVLKKGGWSW